MNTSSRESKALMNPRRKNSYNSLFYLLVVLLLSGCSSDHSVDVNMKVKLEIENLEKAIQTLDKGINTLATESRSWQSVLENSQKQLTADAKSIIKNEITDLIKTGIASVGEESRCNADFVGQRSRHALIEIRNELAKEVNELAKKLGQQERIPLKPVKSLEPAVCIVNPSSIDVARVDLEREGLNKLEISGYDFKPSSIKVILKDRDQTEEDVSTTADSTSKYNFILNLSKVNGVPLSPVSDKLILKGKGNDTIISTISIIQPSYNKGLTKNIWEDISAGRITIAKAIILNKISWRDGERGCSTVGYEEIAEVRKKIDEATNFCVARVRNDINAGNPSTSNAIFQGVISWQNAQTQCKYMLGEEIERVRQAPGLEASAFCR
ncbi:MULTISPECIES: hypothetical protein [unclassified Microcoleus]|uniref:hypothetical protein n=1 Tax=unclassified Microcoleus TaxID=2642155 RepID=UPI002FD297D5